MYTTATREMATTMKLAKIPPSSPGANVKICSASSLPFLASAVSILRRFIHGIRHMKKRNFHGEHGDKENIVI